MEPWQEPRQGRGWLILLLGITVFAAFGAVVGYAYLKGLPGIGGEPPLIRAAGRTLPACARRSGRSRGRQRQLEHRHCTGAAERAAAGERFLPPETAPALEFAEPDAEPGVRGRARTRPGALPR